MNSLDFREFQGIRFDQEKIDLKSVVQAPFDVISSQQQNQFYTLKRRNIVEYLKGNAQDFSQIAKCFQSLRDNRILIEDSRPAFYLCSQEFAHPISNKRVSRVAVIGLVSPQNPLIFPHEKTFKGPVSVREEILKLLPMHLDPVMGLYSDQANVIRQLCDKAKDPIIDLKLDGDNRHRIWAIGDPDSIQGIREAVGKSSIVIADGHHRFEAAKNLGLDSIMMSLISESDPGLRLLATHRLVRKVKFSNSREFEAALEGKFRMTDKNEGQFEVVFQGKSYFLHETEPSHGLNVEIVREKFIKDVLGLSGSDFEKGLAYTEARSEALRLLELAEFNLAVLLKPMRVAELMEHARRGKIFPQKATCFYPKPLSGLVFAEAH